MEEEKFKSKAELDKILKYYFKQDTIYGCSSTPEVVNNILSIIRNATSFEKPDFYCLKDNVCYICEHFEFDASKKLSHKGSKFKREEIFANQRIDKQTNDIILKGQYDKEKINSLGVFNTTINCELNKKMWKENFLTTSNEHYNQLTSYKDHLIKERIITNKNLIKNVFVIEDITEFGGWYSLNNEHILAYPFAFDFGIKQMQLLTNIDFFVYLNKSQRQIMIIDKKSLRDLENEMIVFDNTSILFFNNISNLSGLIIIPKKFLS